jgi:hypothetical protein
MGNKWFVPQRLRRAPLRCARACGSEEGKFFYPDPALALRLGPRLSSRTGLLSIVPGGTGLLLVLAVSSGAKEFVSPPTGLGRFL